MAIRIRRRPGIQQTRENGEQRRQPAEANATRSTNHRTSTGAQTEHRPEGRNVEP